MCMGPSDLDNMRKFLRFFIELSVKCPQPGEEHPVSFQDGCHMHDSGEGVIAGLTAIDVVVGMHALASNLTTQQLDRPIGYHLVRVHVGLRTRTRLPHHQREVVVQLPLDYLVGGPHDGVGCIINVAPIFGSRP